MTPAQTHKARLTAAGLKRIELWVTDSDKTKIKSDYEQTESHKIKTETVRKYEMQTKASSNSRAASEAEKAKL